MEITVCEAVFSSDREVAEFCKMFIGLWGQPFILWRTLASLGPQFVGKLVFAAVSWSAEVEGMAREVFTEVPFSKLVRSKSSYSDKNLYVLSNLRRTDDRFMRSSVFSFFRERNR